MKLRKVKACERDYLAVIECKALPIVQILTSSGSVTQARYMCFRYKNQVLNCTQNHIWSCIGAFLKGMRTEIAISDV